MSDSGADARTDRVESSIGDSCMDIVVNRKCATCPFLKPIDNANKIADCADPQKPAISLEDYYDDVVVKRDIDYANTKRALEITEQFIIDNKLILIGGMAIDMALKVLGRPGIYLSEKLPDYDFISPDSVRDASMLANQLCKAGVRNISAINAMHTTTIKVRANFTPAADIGYCPPDVYKEMPTLEAGQMRIIHPHFQIIDIHRSLAYPFDRAQVIGAGMFHRWKKDAVRYDLLLEAYPIKSDATTSTVKKTTIQLNSELIGNDCIVGWGAIDYWKKVAQGNAKNPLPAITQIEVPDGEPVQIFTDNFSKYVSQVDTVHTESISYYEQLLGHLPRCIRATIKGQRYEIFDNLGALLSAERAGDMYVANMQHCMEFLVATMYMRARNASDEIKSHARFEYTECAQIVSSADRPGLLPSTNVYGSENWDESYLIGRRKFVARLLGTKLKTKDNIDGAYPAPPACKSNIDFDYDASPYFAISGKKCPPFIKRAVPNIVG